MSAAERIFGLIIDVIIIILAPFKPLSLTMDAIIILLWTYHNVSTGCNSKDTIIIDESIIFYFIDKPITTIIQWLVYSSKAFINNYWVIIIVTAVFEFQVQPWMRLLSLYYHIHWQIDYFASNQTIGPDNGCCYFFSIQVSG